jgi:hypothetical protein
MIPDAEKYAAYVTAAIQQACANVLAAPKPSGNTGGQRNETLNTEAFNLGQLVGAGVADEGVVQTALYEAAIAAGLEERETVNTIYSGLSAGMAHPRDLSRLNGVSPVDEPTVLTVDDPINPRGLVDWAAFWANESPEIEWLCEPLVAAGQAVALYSPAKTGKSLLLLEIVAAIATGNAVLGNPKQDPATVMYIDHEGTEDDLRERMDELGYSAETDLKSLHYYLLGDWPPLDTEEGGKCLYEEAVRIGARLIVLDTISRAFAGEEDAADTFLALYRHTVRRLKLARIAFLRLDHSGKDVARGQRGTSAKTTDVDAVWRLMIRGPEQLTLTRELSRSGYGPGEVFLRRDLGPLRHVPETADFAHEHDVERIIILLDEHDIPVEAGRPAAAKVLRANGHAVRNSILSEAIKRRRIRLTPTVLYLVPPMSDSAKGGSGQPGTAREQPGDSQGTGPAPASPLSPVPPPLRGGPGTGARPASAKPLCRICLTTMDQVLVDAGYDTHLGCADDNE